MAELPDVPLRHMTCYTRVDGTHVCVVGPTGPDVGRPAMWTLDDDVYERATGAMRWRDADGRTAWRFGRWALVRRAPLCTHMRVLRAVEAALLDAFVSPTPRARP